MKFTCEKYVLQAAVMSAAKAASPKSPIPTLEGLLVQAGAGVKITGYNLKEGIYTTIEADVKKTGAAVFNAKLFVEMVRLMPDGIISVETDDNGAVYLRCGKSEYSFISMDADEYPELSTIDGSEAVSIPQRLLRRVIDETCFAIATNESRPVYTGSLFEIDGGTLTVVSLDGYRMALRREKLEDCDKEGLRFIIPGAALQDVERLCGDVDDGVLINVGTKHVSFTIGDTVIVSRRLEGDFLNYKKAVPDVFRSELKIERAEFLSIVERVALVVDEKARNPIRLIFGDGVVDFSCVTALGRAGDSCPCEGEGGDVEIGFNDRYLRDALRAAPASELKICINTGSSPCVILPAEGDAFMYMILPVRLRAGE